MTGFYPQPLQEYRKKQRAKVEAKKQDKRDFQERIKKLDGYKCMNPFPHECKQHLGWSAHHIIFGKVVDNSDENGITFCNVPSHYSVHHGTKELTARQFMIAVLKRLKTLRIKELFRWGDALEELKRKEG